MALPGDIAKVSALQDPVLRNLYITQRYHDLSEALTQTIGGPNVNWSTFATWASKTAGQSIRNEEVPPFVVDLVGDAEDDAMHHLGRIGALIHDLAPTTGFHASFLLAPVKETIGTVSRSIGDGNLKVFRELAPLFVQFVETMQAAGAAPTQAVLAGFLETLDPHPTADGGQDMLRFAFTNYHRAILEPDDVEKARLVLAGNCQIGVHEQTRLQPQIAEAMDAPIDTILKKHLHGSVNTGAGRGLFQRIVDAIEAPLADLTDVVEDLWERVATRYLMNLALPGGAELPLGRNIPKDASAQDFLPPALQNVTAPDDLVVLIKKYDRARGTSDVGSGSVDWRLLDDRMNFIVNLFRSRQVHAPLLGQPFTDAQRALIEQGQVPGGTLGSL
ncbi:MAG TPA: hypothetical protein VHS09_05440 [Polyangiaceae bacterium]|nr:hypothetical protein [Polyangiaceae bacterium]